MSQIQNFQEKSTYCISIRKNRVLTRICLKIFMYHFQSFAKGKHGRHAGLNLLLALEIFEKKIRFHVHTQGLLRGPERHFLFIKMTLSCNFLA